ncbi:spermatogenesis-associated protein 7 homolog isoform X2 [Eleutherodactylus coqui]|uniref:spermatogenesis-associated protein 7 homolog isoform X2 n=1 Tax=Eleutherodactylus coqui TaxID=57060 RepID=UPI0034636185
MAPTHGEIPSVPIPKYSMTGPFKGHRSVKSSPLFPGSSCSLSTQFLIQDHMATHYRKLNAAKDRDQQNKERLLRAVEKFQKELERIYSTSHRHSQGDFPEGGAVYYRHRKTLVDKIEELLDAQKTQRQRRSPMLIARDAKGHIGKEHYGENFRASISPGPHRKKLYNDPQKQTYSGDLLDKHCAAFTSTNKTFKPRILKKPARSFLSQYRYYTAPTKRMSPVPGNCEDKPEVLRSVEDEYTPAETLSPVPQPGAEKGWNVEERAGEEDLNCLRFLEDVTNDLILRGCRSDSALERVFQDHRHRKHRDIHEWKKLELLEELREELRRRVKMDDSITYDGTQYTSESLPLRGNLRRLLGAQ